MGVGVRVGVGGRVRASAWRSPLLNSARVQRSSSRLGVTPSSRAQPSVPWHGCNPLRAGYVATA